MGISGTSGTSPYFNYNANGQPMTINGIEYTKGLGVKANTILNIAISKHVSDNYDYLVFDIGFDDSETTNQPVTIEVYDIYNDFSSVLVYQSGPITKGMVKTVKIPIFNGINMRGISLVTNTINPSGALVNWADIRFIKEGNCEPDLLPQPLDKNPWRFAGEYLDLTITYNKYPLNGPFPESAHPYDNNFDNTWTYTGPSDVISLNVTFSSDTFTENNFDWIYIYDKNDVQIGEYSGSELAGQTIKVPGNIVKIRLITDEKSVKHGFRVTGIKAEKAEVGGVNGLYYLRHRYMDPLTGRMLSEDSHWSINNMIYGDNPVKWNERQADPRDPLGLNTYTLVPDINAIRQSGNLYAFCANNPVTFVDPSGERLAFPGEIHRQVSKHIVQNNPDLVREKWVIYPGINNPLGRVDLVDINNGWIFEIKPWYWPRWEAENQLAQYTWGSFLNKQLKTLGREPKPYPGTGDDYKFNDYFYYNRYWVGYWYDGNGIISYTYVEDPNKVIQEMAIAGGIAFAIFMYIITQGAYSPGIPGLTY